MSEDNKFNWKSLFVNIEQQQKSNSKESTNDKRVSFPEVKKSPDSFPEVSETEIENTAVLESVLKMYEKGFDTLNQPGYDFFEFFKSVISLDVKNQKSYEMAYVVATSIEKNINKKLLLEKADFYIQKINEVHGQYVKDGVAKKVRFIETQKQNKQSLTNRITELQNKISALQKELEGDILALKQEDESTSGIQEIDQKLKANDIARSTILNEINKVREGINLYIS